MRIVPSCVVVGLLLLVVVVVVSLALCASSSESRSSSSCSRCRPCGDVVLAPRACAVVWGVWCGRGGVRTCGRSSRVGARGVVVLLVVVLAIILACLVDIPFVAVCALCSVLALGTCGVSVMSFICALYGAARGSCRSLACPVCASALGRVRRRGAPVGLVARPVGRRRCPPCPRRGPSSPIRPNTPRRCSAPAFPTR